SPIQVPFLRGTPPEASVRQVYGAEIFIVVKTRPMKPGEKADRFEAITGEDRFERLTPTPPAPPVPPTPPPAPAAPLEKAAASPAATPQIVALQDEAIRIARGHLEDTRKRIEVGVAKPGDEWYS